MWLCGALRAARRAAGAVSGGLQATAAPTRAAFSHSALCGPRGDVVSLRVARGAAAVLPRLAGVSAGCAAVRHATSHAEPRQEAFFADAGIDAWAQGPDVRGHAHSKFSSVPYSASALRELGGGVTVPANWMVRPVSTAGMKGSGNKPNQDAFSYTCLESGWIICVVCDGHGEDGEVVAERASRMMPLLLAQHLETEGPAESFRHAFMDAQADLERHFNSEQMYSGTTAAACCVHTDSGEAWFAHAGDSKVVLGDLAGGGSLFMTEDHKAHDPGESQRLKKAGAQVIQKLYDDGDIVSRIFVPRTGTPGLAMSRSLGDGCLKKYGVTAEPEVNEVTDLWQTCRAPAVILATDGLWDTTTIDESISAFAARQQRGLDVGGVVEALCQRAQRRWIEAEHDYCDDITVVLMVPRSSVNACHPT